MTANWVPLAPELLARISLAPLGLARVVVGDGGSRVVIPTTATAGSFEGSNAGTVREDLGSRVEQAFTRRGFTSEIFISVGGENWSWGAATK